MSTDLHPQYCPSQALVANPDLPRSPPVSPWWLLFKNDANEKKGSKWPKTFGNPFSKKLKLYPEALPLMNGGLKIFEFYHL